MIAIAIAVSLMILADLFYVYFLSKILPRRFSFWICVSVIAIITIIISVVIEMFSHLPYFVLVMVNSSALLLITLYLFRGKLWGRVIAFVYFYMAARLCSAVGLAIYSIIFEAGPEEVVPVIVGMGVSLLLYILFGFLSVSMWRKIPAHRLQPFYMLFVVLQLSQSLISLHFSPTIPTEIMLISAAIFLIGSAVLFFFVLSHEKNGILEAELNETRRKVELEQTRHKEFETRRDEMAKIRHDFNNQLASIIQLVRVGEDKTAQEIIDALTDEINQAMEG